MDKYKAVDEALGKMTLRQKAGQLFTQSFYGSLVTSDVENMIRNMDCGGLRITSFYRQFRHYARPGQKREAFDQSSPSDMPANQFSDVKDQLCKPPYLNIDEYAAVMNRLKEVASERNYNSPLHLCLDQEGDASADFIRGGVSLFPSQWGIARTGDPKLVYESAKAVGMQLAAIGVNVVHAPVLDVVLHADSTYIGTRGFGQETEFVIEMAAEYIRGFKDAGVMCAGKHYPGRGSTAVDDHHDIGSIDRTEEELMECELLPYRRLKDLPMLMVGHSIYPAWDKDNLASCSRAVCTDVTRGKIGFDGVITTDSMIMLAIAKKYGIPQACVLSAKAGCNLILMKETGAIRDEAYRLMVEAAESGDLPESQLDELVGRTLRWKADYGLFGDNYIVDAAAAPGKVRSVEVLGAAKDAAEGAVHVVRDENRILPLSQDQRVLLVEQIAGPHLNANDKYLYPGIFWDKMLAQSQNVSLLEIELDPSAADLEKLMDYAPHYDAIVVTHYSDRNTLSTVGMVNQLMEKMPEKKVVVVANSPLPYKTPEAWPAVVCSYGVGAEVLETAAKLLFGNFTPQSPAIGKPWDR
ncbi:MAG: glycoside hydrolase family 3 N-terminal domain-containing protein [Verrucomicrobiota bacterium]|nr:glycoside hydrolase family 3 N-terminal domain-containing protein [Verrucomicrobiota bacterium]